MNSRRICVFLTIGLLGVSCSHEGAPAPRVAPVTPSFAAPTAAFTSTPAPTSPASVVATCSNQSATVSASDLRLPGSITGDVDGDGVMEQIQLALDRGARQGCQAFLVAQVGTSLVSGAVASWTLEGGLPQPRLHSVAQINGTGGDEVVVDVAVGASSQFVSVFTDLDGVLLPLIFDKQAPDGFKDMFPYGGSVGHVDAPDCAAGEVVVSSAVAGGNSYQVTRRFFTVHNDALKADTARDQTTTATFNGLARFPEFPAAPFGSCPA